MNWKGSRTEVFEKAATSFRLIEAQGICNDYLQQLRKTGTAVSLVTITGCFSGVRFSTATEHLFSSVLTVSATHPATSPMNGLISSSVVIATSRRGQECVALLPPLAHTSSWRRALFITGTKLPSSPAPYRCSCTLHSESHVGCGPQLVLSQ